MVSSELVRAVRAFNRFYMPYMHLLGNRYLGSEYAVAEARIFFEIYQNEGCNAAHIAQAMNIDKSYLSRILKKHEKSGYLRRMPAGGDGRSYALFLTDSGRARAEEFIRRSDEEIGRLLDKLTPEEEARLSNALAVITGLLQKQEGGTPQ